MGDEQRREDGRGPNGPIVRWRYEGLKRNYTRGGQLVAFLNEWRRL